MKFIFLLAITLFGNAADSCDKQAKQSPRPTPEQTAMETKKTDLSLTVTAQQTGKTLSLTYRAVNNSKNSLVLLNRLPNRGADAQSVGPNKVYLVPQADGSIEISKRAILPPDDIDAAALILPLGMRLEPGKVFSETVTLTLPLALSHPYSSSKTLAAMPEKPARVNFCLGYVPGAAATRDAEIHGEKLVYASVAALQKQDLACAEVSF